MTNKQTRTRRPDAPELIRLARERNPNATAAGIAEEIGGISRQRVSQLIREMKLPTRVAFTNSGGERAIGWQTRNLITELVVVKDLIEKRFSVYRPITSESLECDIVINYRGGKLLKMDVRPELSAGVYHAGESDKFDCIAYVSLTHRIKYEPELNAFID